jgi:trehalose synthase
MNDNLKKYAEIAGYDVIRHLQQLSETLKGKKVIHVNSTREGGGVAEILNKLIPLKKSLGINAEWEVITGDPSFFSCTKTFHNALQGNPIRPDEKQLNDYERINKLNAKNLREKLEQADFVFIHDPQPAALIESIPRRKGKWIWRCHIDVSRPNRFVWKYLQQWVEMYNASIFSLPEFAQRLKHPQYLITPSIDPLSEKNIELPDKEVKDVLKKFNLNRNLPMVLQVSRFDKFKDPLGVIEAYKIAHKLIPLQLVLAGGGASDDPEGEEMLRRVTEAAGDDPNLHILSLPPDAHRTINALQRAADIVIQKSTREGFGLTVAEAMWKKKPVIGGDTGGIRVQVIDHYTGFLVRTPEGAALRIRYLLHRRDKLKEISARAHRFVRENFLLTRQLRDYLTLMISLEKGPADRIEVG